jgi:hypothetical protein
MLCPDSKAAYYTWKAMFNQSSHVENKTYGELVDMKITPYVLPYHLHSW